MFDPDPDRSMQNALRRAAIMRWGMVIFLFFVVAGLLTLFLRA